MTLLDYAALFLAGLLGAAGNALAGGGTFFTFPTMLEVGLSPVVANASSAVALWPGRIPSVVAGWPDLMRNRPQVVRSCILAAIGSLAGALLLLFTRERVFTALIPWLLLFSTLLFAYGARLVAAFRRLRPAGGGSGMASPAIMAAEFAIAIYGGYFGAGAAFIIMAVHAMAGLDDIHQSVALKNLTVTMMTTVSVAAFISAGVVAWPAALAMMIGGITGGYAGAMVARRLDPGRLRGAIIAIGAALTAYYFWKVYG